MVEIFVGTTAVWLVEQSRIGGAELASIVREK
jgi:hypothetical protein